ncbi:MAG: hypothetical protein WC485_00290 [Opitutaceae bacterium]
MRTLEAHCGEHVSETARRMVQLANDTGEQVTCSFNEIELTAVPGCAAEDITLHYDTESRRRSEEYNARPEVIAQRAEWARKEAEKRATLAAILADAPPIMLRNELKWKSRELANQDGYGKAVVDYAEKWARIMQTRIAVGSAIAECAEEASRIADDEGITGAMYGFAVRVLADCWQHGEELRRWHNLDVQIGTEGEKANERGSVLNPAMLTLR